MSRGERASERGIRDELKRGSRETDVFVCRMPDCDGAAHANLVNIDFALDQADMVTLQTEYSGVKDSSHLQLGSTRPRASLSDVEGMRTRRKTQLVSTPNKLRCPSLRLSALIIQSLISYVFLKQAGGPRLS